MVLVLEFDGVFVVSVKVVGVRVWYAGCWLVVVGNL